ncbi:MAG: hypothetical protein ACOYVK_07170 [Bacillota bacterium]
MGKKAPIILLVILIFTAFTPGCSKDNKENVTGYTYSVDSNGKQVKKENITDLYFTITENKIKGNFYIQNSKFEFNAKAVKKDEKNKITYYNGTAKFNDKDYLIDIIDTEDKGMSGLFYNKGRNNPLGFVISY